MSMRRTPLGVYREGLGDERPPVWYAIWLGPPHAKGSVRIGKTKRLRKRYWHRTFSAAPNQWPQDIEGWVSAVEHLARVWRGHKGTLETCTAKETERVKKIKRPRPELRERYRLKKLAEKQALDSSQGNS
jgi:hypothetical protein